MRTNWRWLRKGLILSLLPLVFALYAMASGDGDHKETKYRWDIITVTSNPPTVNAGGFASAIANDGSKITITGHGTFEPRESDEVTGGGTWTTFAPGGKTVTGHGTYSVRQLVRFDVAPGVMTPGTVDNIPGAKGDLTDNRAGLMFVKIAYSDGSKGVLVFSCGLDGSPASIFEGVTASKGYTDYWNSVPGLTLFHIFHQDENRDRE